MADSLTAKKATGTLPVSSATKNKLAQADKRKRQLLLILILIICCALSFYFFKNTMALVDDQMFVDQEITEPNIELATETKDIQETADNLTSITRASGMAMQTALLAEVSGKYPVAPTTLLMPPVIDTPSGPQIVEEIPLEPEPPLVTVLAVMITDSDKVAMLDVAGEDGGLIVRQGSSFSNGTAKVTKIDSKGVTFTWMKKNYQVSIEQ